MAAGGLDLLRALGVPLPTGGGAPRPAPGSRPPPAPAGGAFDPGPAPSYSAGLEFALQLLLQKMDPRDKLALSRRMLDVFRNLEQVALSELGGSEPDGE